MKEPLALLPFVPSGPDFSAARRLFVLLGFKETWVNGGVAGFEFGSVKFILQEYDNKAFGENYMLKLVVDDPDAWWADYQTIADTIAKEFPTFRINPPKDFPWGREVNFIDLAGVCWHVGT